MPLEMYYSRPVKWLMALHGEQVVSGILGLLLQSLGDIRQGLAAVDFRLADAEHVEVGTVQQADLAHRRQS